MFIKENYFLRTSSIIFSEVAVSTKEEKITKFNIYKNFLESLKIRIFLAFQRSRAKCTNFKIFFSLLHIFWTVLIIPAYKNGVKQKAAFVFHFSFSLGRLVEASNLPTKNNALLNNFNFWFLINISADYEKNSEPHLHLMWTYSLQIFWLFLYF